MNYENIKAEYYETLQKLAEEAGKTIEELDAEISNEVKNCKDIEEIMLRASEIFNE